MQTSLKTINKKGIIGKKWERSKSERERTNERKNKQKKRMNEPH